MACSEPGAGIVLERGSRLRLRTGVRSGPESVISATGPGGASVSVRPGERDETGRTATRSRAAFKDTAEKLRDRAVREGQGDPRIHLDSFIVSVTPRAEMKKRWRHCDPTYFAERHVVFQEDGSNIYIRRILEGMGVLPPADEAAQQLSLEDAG